MCEKQRERWARRCAALIVLDIPPRTFNYWPRIFFAAVSDGIRLSAWGLGIETRAVLTERGWEKAAGACQRCMCMLGFCRNVCVAK